MHRWWCWHRPCLNLHMYLGYLPVRVWEKGTIIIKVCTISAVRYVCMLCSREANSRQKPKWHTLCTHKLEVSHVSELLMDARVMGAAVAAYPRLRLRMTHRHGSSKISSTQPGVSAVSVKLSEAKCFENYYVLSAATI